MEKYINNKDQKKLKNNKIELLKGFKNIANNNNFESIFKNNIYEDLNNFIIEDIDKEECIPYFTAKIIDFLSIKKIYNWQKNIIYFGTNLKLSELLQYEWAKGRSIQFPKFTIFYEKKELAEKLSNRKQSQKYYKDNLKFSVIFILEKKGKYCDGINIEDLLPNKEKAILFLPLVPLQMKNIDFDFPNFTADVYLENI